MSAGNARKPVRRLLPAKALICRDAPLLCLSVPGPRTSMAEAASA
jgi:hypothetical protein